MADTNTQVKFLKGHSSRLSTIAPQDGHFYLTEDTHKLYAGIGSGDSAILALLNHDITFVNKVADLTTETHSTDQLYYAKDENVLAIYNETAGEFVQINPDDGATSVSITGEGPALTGVSYDASTRTLVFTRGEITAAQVKTTQTITVTKDVGNYTKGQKIEVSDLENILLNMLCTDADPTANNPSTAITLRDGGSSGSEKTSEVYVEVGKSFTPGFKVSNNIGSYTANGVSQASGVIVIKTTVTQSGRPDTDTTKYEDTTGLTTINSAFPAFTVADSTSYRMSVTTNFSAGTEPTTFLGKQNDATKAVTIAKSDKTANTVYVKSYRSWFVGGTDAATVDGSVVAGLTNKGRTYGTIEVKAADYSGCTKIVVAVPSDANKTLKTVYLKSSSNADILGEFKEQTSTVDVKGYNGYAVTKPYKLWIYEPASLDPTEVYTITAN